MLQSPDKKIILLYFEKKAKRETITKLKPGAVYIAKWFNPRTGEWIPMSKKELKVDKNGDLELPKFPSGKAISENDWAAKLVLSE
jgi:hypothetical protein